MKQQFNLYDTDNSRNVGTFKTREEADAAVKSYQSAFAFMRGFKPAVNVAISTVLEPKDLPGYLFEAVHTLSNSQKKVTAIKLLRGWYSDVRDGEVLGLKDAKDFCDSIDGKPLYPF